jgi:hypothetical protein
MSDAMDWREKATELRAAAERTADRVTQESLLLLAQDCDAFAEKEEPRPRDALAAGAPDHSARDGG